MITIHNIDETLLFYGSLGAEQKEIGNCTLFTFFDKTSYVLRLPMSGFGEICMVFVWLLLTLYFQRI